MSTYNVEYRRARAAILGPSGNGLLPEDMACVWRGPRCEGIATTADHELPIVTAGWHLNLVPACGPCNFRRGQHQRRAVKRGWIDRFA